MVVKCSREGVATYNDDVNGVVKSISGALKAVYLVVLNNPGIKIAKVVRTRRVGIM